MQLERCFAAFASIDPLRHLGAAAFPARRGRDTDAGRYGDGSDGDGEEDPLARHAQRLLKQGG